jgi:hypothetical protein
MIFCALYKNHYNMPPIILISHLLHATLSLLYISAGFQPGQVAVFPASAFAGTKNSNPPPHAFKQNLNKCTFTMLKISRMETILCRSPT